jgi:iron(III) transport system substrate-binding protein
MRFTQTRRSCIGFGALALSAWLAGPAWAEAPKPSPVTPELLAAAKAEGRVVFYTAVDVLVGEKLGKAFEAKYPGITVQVERAGAERNFQRIMQEYGSNIHAADVIDSSDATHLLLWKRKGWLAPYVPEGVERWPAAQRDSDGFYAANRANLSVIGYNSKQIKPADAPKSFADLLDPKWRGKMVKGHPGYSGTIMTATFEISEALGWSFFEKLGKQRVMQVQSSTEPPKKVALGERPIMADGNEYNLLLLKEDGAPIEAVYPTEGTPLVSGMAGIMKDGPHPNAARLFTSFLFSLEGQQLMSDVGALRTFHPDVKEKPGRKPFHEIKLLEADTADQEKAIETIRSKYTEYFGT